MLVKNLNGHSGCEVQLIKTNSNLIVRKISESCQYNDRLINQIEKQKIFKSNIIEKPTIFDCFFQNDKFCCDMQFINGVNLYNFVENSDKLSISSYFEKIMFFIENNNFINESINDDIIQKINNLKIDNKYEFFVNYCCDYDWNKVNKSYCHGDLTFENILIFNKKIYFIDFLDSFTNTKFIDISKLLQDVIVAWSWRHENNQPYIKLIYIYEIIKSFINKEELEISKKLLVLNLLRILPYCKTHDDIKLVEERLLFLKRYYINE